MALMLLIGGGLLMRSFVKLVNVDPGYEPSNILTFQVSIPGGRAAAPRILSFAEDLVARVRGIPGVRAAGYSEGLPMVQMRSGAPLRTTPDLPAPTPSPASGPRPAVQFADTHLVSHDFLRVIGMRIVSGRGLTYNDGAGQPLVMLINRTLARTAMFDGYPLGRQIYVLGRTPWQVVGVVDDVRQYGLDQEPAPQVFIDLRQLPQWPPGSPPPGAVEYFAILTEGERAVTVSSIREIVRQLEPQATVESVATMAELVSNSVARPRMYALLLGLFAAVAAVLAAIGVYGVLSYAVSQRVREIGIRMALGAERTNVMRLVLGQSLVLTAAGLMLGIGGAVAVTRYLETMLFGLTPLDRATFVIAPVAFALIALVAAYVPARRATRVDPLVALRHD